MASSWSTLLLALSVLCMAHADVQVYGIRGSGLHGDAMSPPDPYVKVFCGGTFGGMTEFLQDQANPSWSVTFTFATCRVGDALKLEVWDKDLMKDDRLGTCTTTVQNTSSYKSVCNLARGTLTFYHRV